MASNQVKPRTGPRKPLPSECEAPQCTKKPRCRLKGLALCGMHYQRQTVHSSFELPERVQAQWSTCSRPGCDKPSRTRSGALCEMHYYRSYKTGSFEGPSYKRRYLSTSGYVLIAGRADHPIAPKSGVLYEHRMVLYDALGEGPHACHWCGVVVDWRKKGRGKLVVDHLDGNKEHNSLSNLVASCHRCNSTRGLFQEWVMQHKDDPFLWRLYQQARDAA